MGHAGDFVDAAGLLEVLEAGIPVRAHPTGETLEMADWAAAFAIDREPIQGGGMRVACPGPFVPDIGPESGRLGFANSRHLNLHSRVVGEDRLTGEHMPTDGFSQGLEQRRLSPDLIRQGRALQADAVPFENLGLAIKRQMVCVFFDQHMGQQTRPWPATLNRA